MPPLVDTLYVYWCALEDAFKAVAVFFFDSDLRDTDRKAKGFISAGDRLNDRDISDANSLARRLFFE